MYKARITLVLLLAICVGIVCTKACNKMQQAEFKDSEIKFIITEEAKYIGILEDEEALKKEHLNKINEINLGYLVYYGSIIDVVKCENLEYLTIGAQWGYMSHYHRFISLSETRWLKDDEITKFQDELTEIFKSCKKIKCFKFIYNENTCKLKDFSFLLYAENLQELRIEKTNNIDCSVFYEIDGLKKLSIRYCDLKDLEGIEVLKDLEYLNLDKTNINSTNDILKLENLQVLSIVGTPLAENEDEIKKIYERFPDIDIKMRLWSED